MIPTQKASSKKLLGSFVVVSTGGDENEGSRGKGILRKMQMEEGFLNSQRVTLGY